MQAIEKNELRRFPEMYNPERMDALLEEEEVKEVRVFRLKKGMTVEVGGTSYKVVTCREDGKIVLKRKKKDA